MKVESAIRESIHEGQEFLTPRRRQPFVVDRIDNAGVVLLLGKGRWPTRIGWDCWEGIVPFVRNHGNEVKIGGRHEVAGNPGTLDEWLKGCVKRTTAGWVAVILEAAGVVDISADRPQRIRLTRPWRSAHEGG